MEKNKKTSWNFKDLTGQTFNHLYVLKRAPNRGKELYWLCQCDCGNILEVNGHNLRSGHTKSCGCLKYKHEKNLTGKKFGKLTVLYKSNKTCINGEMWVCKCDCGNEIVVSRNHLVTNHTLSCGCYQKEQTSKTNSANLKSNTRFGKLIVIKEAYKKNQQTYWMCKCDCGNIINVSTAHLNSGHTKSCGCLKSTGELTINLLLTENNILYTTQKTFDNCRYENNYFARFDFYINNSYLLEYDGKQHFEGWSQDINDLKIQQERDNFKNQWCKDNNIPLIRIPYTKLDTLCLEDLLLETTQFRVV